VTVSETIFVYGAIPALILFVVGGLAYASGSRNVRRYRPGRPYQEGPVWFLAGGDPGTRPAITTGSEPASRPAPIGGASDRW